MANVDQNGDVRKNSNMCVAVALKLAIRVRRLVQRTKRGLQSVEDSPAGGSEPHGDSSSASGGA